MRERAGVGGATLRWCPEVAARVEYRRRTIPAVMDRRELLEYLTAVVRTPAGALHLESELAEAVGFRGGAKEFWMPSKLGCLMLAVRLLGLQSGAIGEGDRRAAGRRVGSVQKVKP